MVSNFHCKLRIQGIYYVFKMSLWNYYIPSGKLGESNISGDRRVGSFKLASQSVEEQEEQEHRSQP